MPNFGQNFAKICGLYLNVLRKFTSVKFARLAQLV